MLLLCSRAIAGKDSQSHFDSAAFLAAAFSQDTPVATAMLPRADQASKDRALIETVMRLCSPAFQLRNHHGEVRAVMLEFDGAGMLSGGQFDAESRRLKEPYVEIARVLREAGAE